MAVVDVDETEVIGEAHWVVFLPVILFAVIFAGLWLALDLFGRGGSIPGRFAFMVAVLVTPLLTLLSFLRYQTARVARSFDGLWIERGWPSMIPRHVPFDSILDVMASDSPIGGRFGAGSLILTLRSGERVTVRDMAEVDALVRRIRPEIAATKAETPAGASA